MVTSKGNTRGGGTRILHSSRDSRSSFGLKDVKIYSGKENSNCGGVSRMKGWKPPGTGRKPAPLLSTTRTSTIHSRSNVSKENTTCAKNNLSKSHDPANLKDERKALVDVTNLNSIRSHKAKTICRNGADLKKKKKEKVDLIHESFHGARNFHQPRVSLAKAIVVANGLSKKPLKTKKKKPEETLNKHVNSETTNMRSIQKKISSDGRISVSSILKLKAVDVKSSKKPRAEIKISRLTGSKSNKISISRNASIPKKYDSEKMRANKDAEVPENLNCKNHVCAQGNSIAINRYAISDSSIERVASNVPGTHHYEKETASAPRCRSKNNVISISTSASTSKKHGCSDEKVAANIHGARHGDVSDSSDKVTVIVPRAKCIRRKSFTSMFIGECNHLCKMDKLPNIDDDTNHLEVVEYVDEIYKYYWNMELQNPLPEDYTTHQGKIISEMRAILVDWLIEVHYRFDLMQETLFLMVELLDRTLSVVPIKKGNLQLVGLTALLLASKYEDFWHPKIKELLSISVFTYTRSEILTMEKLILEKLRYRLNLPTPYVFMLRFLKAAQSDEKLEHLSFYLIELCLVEFEAVKFRPSLLSASAIYVACCTLQIFPTWSELLKKHTRYEETDLRDCADMILRLQRSANKTRLKSTYNKFKKSDRSCIATIESLSELPLC